MAMTHEAAEQRGRGVVGVALDLDRQRQQPPLVEAVAGQRVGGHEAGHRRRRPTSRGRARSGPALSMWMRQPRSAGTWPSAQRKPVSRATTKRLSRVGRQAAGALALDRQLAGPRRVGDLDRDAVAQVERQRQRVEAGARGWRVVAGTSTMTVDSGSPRAPQRLGRRSAAAGASPTGAVRVGLERRLTSRAPPVATPSHGSSTTRAPPSRRGRAAPQGTVPALAVSGSLRPWPVSTQTIVAPRVDATLGDQLAHAGHRGRDGRLAEDALEAGQVAVGGQDLLVGDGLDAPAGLVARRSAPRHAGRVADADGGRHGLGRRRRGGRGRAARRRPPGSRA